MRVLVGTLLFGLFGLVGLAGMLVALSVRRRTQHDRSPRDAKSHLSSACAFVGLLALLLSGINTLSMDGHGSPSGTSASAQCPCVPLTLDGAPENMADLFNEVNLSYYDGDESNRIRIITADATTPPTILVMLPGVLPAHLWDAIKAGMGLPGDPYAAAARHALEEYMRVEALPPGTRVVLAGHSYGGIVAQELAAQLTTQPGSQDFTIVAVVTWGAPAIGSHVPGITYEQYFDRYDFIPLLSTHELAPLAIGSGLIGTLGAVATLQALPSLKAAFTGETYVPDIGQYANPRTWIHLDGTWSDAHDSYGHSHWLSELTLALTPDGRLVVTRSASLDHSDDHGILPLNGTCAICPMREQSPPEPARLPRPR